jgi:ACS family glucarate transporter-like MFS transporter
MLTCFTFVGYLLRVNISVAQQFMVPELGLSDIQVGQVFSSFMVGYALFQVPGGVWGDRRGPRLVLTAAALAWGLTTLLTGLVPGMVVKGVTAAFVSLLVLRFLLGVGEAATYPVAARAVANWMPIREHAFSNAVVIAGSTLGAAFAPPLVANVMQSLGWRATFYLSSLFPLAIALLWWLYARDEPGSHRRVNPAELAVIRAGRGGSGAEGSSCSWWRLAKDRNIALLSASYFLDSYVLFIFVFWLFKYLVDVRKFSIVGGGWASSLPYLIAGLALPSFGHLSDRLSVRLGRLRGRRVVAMACLVLSGLLLLIGARAAEAWIAVAAISLSVGFVFSTEGPYWSTAIDLAGPHAGAAGGLMNMAGNLGGVVSTAVVPLLVHYWGWFSALSSGTIFAISGALLWLLIRSETKTAARPLIETKQSVGEAT